MMPHPFRHRHLLAFSVLCCLLAACAPAGGQDDAPAVTIKPAATVQPQAARPRAGTNDETGSRAPTELPAENATETPDVVEENGGNDLIILTGDTRSEQ